MSPPPPQVLRALASRVLGPTSTISPTVRADLFGDVALQQLAELCAPVAFSDEDAEGYDASAAPLAAAAACETLTALLTDPAHGLVGEGHAPLDTPLVLSHPASSLNNTGTALSGKAAKQAGVAAGSSAGGGGGGAKRVLRLLPRLQPAVVPGHVRVLETVAAGQPALGAEYLSGGPPLVLEPKARRNGVVPGMLQI